MNENKEPLVSIIIPVYNVEPYIKRCLDSISKQTYGNLEIIAVDDGSKDNSADICEECAATDQRITVIRKNNEGAGYARNAGLNIVTGDYIFFVDSDDYILDNCIERLLEVAIHEDADIVKCAWVEGSEDHFATYPSRKPFSVYSNISAFRTRKMNIAIHGKLYKKEVIGDYRYPKVTIHDDEFLTYKLIYNAHKIIVLDEAYYYYYMSPDSIMRGQKKKQPLQYMEAYRERIAFFQDKEEEELVGISHKEYAIRLMLSFINYEKYSVSDLSKDEIYQIFCDEYSSGYKYANSYKEKYSLKIFRMIPNVAKWILAR